MKIKFDESGKVLGFVELGGMNGAVEWDGDREKDNREYIEAHIEECEKISLDNFEL